MRGERRMRKVFPATLIIIVCNYVLVFLPAVSATSEASVYIDPQSINDTSHVPPKTFTINIFVANVTNLHTIEFNMSFDPKTLGYRGQFIGAQNYLPTPAWRVNDTEGFIWFNVTYGLPITSIASIKLANVTFYVRALGTTPIDLNVINLLNSFGDSIPYVASNGFFSNLNPYDLNSDGKVDIRDVTIVALAFGSYPGHPRWNPDADLNNDDSVDIRDIKIVAAHFGQY